MLIIRMKLNQHISTAYLLSATLVVVLFSVFALTSPVAALSCINPMEMNETFAADQTYTVALVKAGTIETAGSEHDQFITTQTLYKGELGTTDTVTFTHNETWDYLCAGQPASEGTQAVYVLQDKVVYPPDSELAQNLITAVDTSPVEPTTVGEKENPPRKNPTR